ncbi:MAG: cytochrome P460 family protein [Thermodesulfobacteriota bacterium]|nr:cytochrome P460 family protein [Thermodesulfobacteriota bacterium]
MKKTAVLVFSIVSCLLLISYSLAEMPGADPKALWDYITNDSPYKEWSFWSDHQGMQPGRAPHGPLHKVYVNDQALNSSRPPVKYGSIVVKENYSKSEALKAITVMYKIDGYNPKDGDWFWVKYSPQGEAKPYGKPAGCVGCHGTRAKNDFILVHEFQ